MPLDNILALTQFVGVIAIMFGTACFGAAVWFHIRSITAKHTELHYSTPGRADFRLEAGASLMERRYLRKRNRALAFTAMGLGLGASSLFVLPPLLRAMAG